MVLSFIWFQIVFAFLIIQYDLFLKGSARFRFNRFFMLSFPVVAILSVWAPTISWIPTNYSLLSGGVLPVIQVPQEVLSESFSYAEYSILVYVVVALSIFSRNIYQLFRTYFSSKELYAKTGRFEVFLTENDSFSVINRLFLSKNDISEELIIEHELVHLNQKHWIDLLVAQIVISLSWVNPFAWRWSILIKQNHEFLADAEVSKSVDFGKTDYIHLLLDKAFETNQFSLGNYFSMHSLISKRISMLNKKRKQGVWGVASLSTALVLSGLVIGSCSKEEPKEEVLVKKITQKTSIDENGEETTTTSESEEKRLMKASEIQEGLDNVEVEKLMPSFKGGQQELFKYLGSELKYPKVCKTEGIEGKVLISFVVSETGGVQAVKVVESVHPDLDEEAIRVIGAMPNWEPGTINGEPVKMEMKFPIKFMMKSNEQ